MRENHNNFDMMWAYLLHLSHNMWGDPGGRETGAPYHPENVTDEDTWKTVIDFLPTQGFNTVVIDVGDAVKYESHPEISIKGAWQKEKLKSELDRMRILGLMPIPKLNFSTRHSAWLGMYRRMTSSAKYYEVCKDLIEEIAELFGRPAYFHLGMDEETPNTQKGMAFACGRRQELLWHDLYFLFDACEKAHCRPWVWADLCWGDELTGVYLERMPKSVLQSNWWYLPIRKNASGGYDAREIQAYQWLENAGFDQVPTCSTIHWYDLGAQDTMEATKEIIAPERLKGYMTAPWHATTKENQYGLLHDAMRFGLAKHKVYPED